METPVIITVAITGSVPRKKDNPAVPVTPAEQIESTQECFEAGATLVHIHVRNPDESPSSDPELFARVQEGVKKYCPGMIIQFSTGGRGREQAKRGAMLYLKPDMASLATGSVNFPTDVYENPPDFIEGSGAHDARKRHQARSRGIRPGDALQRRQPGPARIAGAGSARPVRHGDRPMHCRRDARSSTSCAPSSRRCCPTPPGSPPASAAISGRSTNGVCRKAASAAPDWKTIPASTKPGWPPAMRSWSRKLLITAASTTGGRQRR